MSHKAISQNVSQAQARVSQACQRIMESIPADRMAPALVIAQVNLAAMRYLIAEQLEAHLNRRGEVLSDQIATVPADSREPLFMVWNVEASVALGSAAVENMPLGVTAFGEASAQCPVTLIVLTAGELPNVPALASVPAERRAQLDLALKAAATKFSCGALDIAVHAGDDRAPLAPEEAARLAVLAVNLIRDAAAPDTPIRERQSVAIQLAYHHNLPWLLHIAGQRERAEALYGPIQTSVLPGATFHQHNSWQRLKTPPFAVLRVVVTSLSPSSRAFI